MLNLFGIILCDTAKSSSLGIVKANVIELRSVLYGTAGTVQSNSN